MARVLRLSRKRRSHILPMEKGSLFERCLKLSMAQSVPTDRYRPGRRPRRILSGGRGEIRPAR